MLVWSHQINEINDAAVKAVLHASGIVVLAMGYSNSDDALLNACKAARSASGTDDFSVIVLTQQH